jgi:hypothetical protein
MDESVNSRKANQPRIAPTRHEVHSVLREYSMEGSLPGNPEGDPERSTLVYVGPSTTLQHTSAQLHQYSFHRWFGEHGYDFNVQRY